MIARLRAAILRWLNVPTIPVVSAVIAEESLKRMLVEKNLLAMVQEIIDYNKRLAGNLEKANELVKECK